MPNSRFHFFVFEKVLVKPFLVKKSLSGINDLERENFLFQIIFDQIGLDLP